MSLTENLNSQLSLPVIAAPMFILSQPELVLAQFLSGSVGSFPAMKVRPKKLLDDWLEPRVGESGRIPGLRVQIRELSEGGVGRVE